MRPTPYRLLFDRVLVRLDAEKAHRLGFQAIRLADRRLLLRLVQSPGSPRSVARFSRAKRENLASRRDRLAPQPDRLATQRVQAMGLTFPGPLGLAAGFDKNAEGVDALAALGFSFVEVGTVTAEPQPGNPRPRLFRLPADRAVVNRMGFNNEGAEVVAARLARRRSRHRADVADVVVGVNIGKTKSVPEDDVEAVLRDYEKSTRLLAPYADYLVVNVSSPNTPGLRDLQSVDRLRPLLQAVRRQADAVSTGTGRDCTGRAPLLVKIAPDLSDDDVVAVAALAVELGLDGIVATNTTVARDGLRSDPAEVERAGAGGLSGAPLRERALEVLKLIRDRVGEELTIVAVGGIGDAADARARLEAGATLLQAYTAFIYEGATWPSRVQRELAAR